MQGTRARWSALALLSIALLILRSDASPTTVPSLAPRMQRLPRITVWAWERREDLRALDPSTTAVAYLDRTLTLDAHGLTIQPRRQPMLLPASPALTRIPVIRIETNTGATLTDASAISTADSILAALRPNSAALQIDFDARLSERDWYRRVLTQVRDRLPANMPLSITALASWCSYDSAWLNTLPIDEAVPMLFRMEPDRRHAAALGLLRRYEFLIRAPRCLASVGISTRERWPSELAGRRIYIFPNEGWQSDNLPNTVRQLSVRQLW
jgi:Protein of unknown function (DUF3142)